MVPDSPEFFLTQLLTLDTARVNRDTEALCDSFCYLRTGDRWLGELKLCHELHQFGRELVSGPGPAFLGQQSGKTSFLKGCLCLIE